MSVNLEVLIAEVKGSLDNLNNKLNTLTGDTGEIKEQVKKTNGRVKSLELWQARIDGGRIALKGLWWVVGGLTTAGIAGVWMQFYQLPETIRDEVKEQISQVNFQIEYEEDNKN